MGENAQLLDRQWHSIDFWRAFAPELHIEDGAFIQSTTLFNIDSATTGQLKDLIKREGYFQLPPPAWSVPIDDLGALVAKLNETGIPLAFAFAFDEFWQLFIKLNHLLEGQLGSGYQRLPDFWVWHVDPAQDQGGWRPHRDKGFRALHPDGSPKSLTVWIPLSESNPLNGCMYMVPADRDPTYASESDGQWKFELSDVRALPAQAGSIFVWNQAVLHWGSRGNARETRPRMSVAFEFQAGDVPPFNAPLMEPLSIPNFGFRLQLIAKQILQYQHMYPLSAEVRAIAEKLAA